MNTAAADAPLDPFAPRLSVQQVEEGSVLAPKFAPMA